MALKRFMDELNAEKTARVEHFIVTGGSLCVIRKGISTTHILGKGDPVPMTKDTAKKNKDKFQPMCTDDVELKIIPYTEWLESNIEECNKLLDCMRRTMAGEEQESTDVQDIPVPTQEPATVPCIVFPRCPYGVNSCYTCKFVTGVDINTLPWKVQCSHVQKKSEKDC